MKEENILLIKILGGILSGFFLQICGVIMIFKDLEGHGNISVESLLLNARISATDIGLLVIFLGVILQIFVIMKKINIHKETNIEKEGTKEKIYVKGNTMFDGGMVEKKYDIYSEWWRRLP